MTRMVNCVLLQREAEGLERLTKAIILVLKLVN